MPKDTFSQGKLRVISWPTQQIPIYSIGIRCFLYDNKPSGVLLLAVPLLFVVLSLLGNKFLFVRIILKGLGDFTPYIKSRKLL